MSFSGVSLLWVVTRFGKAEAPWYPERFFFLVAGHDGPADAVKNLVYGLSGLKLITRPVQKYGIRHDGEDRLPNARDLLVIDARPAFVHQEGVAFAKAVDDSVALVAADNLDVMLKGGRLNWPQDAKFVLRYLSARAEGLLE